MAGYKLPLKPHGSSLKPHGNTGKVRSPETRAKISAANRGRTRSLQHRANMSAGMTAAHRSKAGILAKMTETEREQLARKCFAKGRDDAIASPDALTNDELMWWLELTGYHPIDRHALRLIYGTAFRRTLLGALTNADSERLIQSAAGVVNDATLTSFHRELWGESAAA